MPCLIRRGYYFAIYKGKLGKPFIPNASPVFETSFQMLVGSSSAATASPWVDFCLEGAAFNSIVRRQIKNCRQFAARVRYNISKGPSLGGPSVTVAGWEAEASSIRCPSRRAGGSSPFRIIHNLVVLNFAMASPNACTWALVLFCCLFLAAFVKMLLERFLEVCSACRLPAFICMTLRASVPPNPNSKHFQKSRSICTQTHFILRIIHGEKESAYLFDRIAGSLFVFIKIKYHVKHHVQERSWIAPMNY